MSRSDSEVASYAQEQDLYKQIATLSTGALVLLVTFLKELFSNPIAKAWVAATLIGFVSATTGAVLMQLMSVLHLDADGHLKRVLQSPTLFLIAAFLTFGGFAIGIVGLVTFAILNLYH